MQRPVGTEDCLVLSVHTPSNLTSKLSSNLPVMVWIHGGGFAMDSGDCQMYGPEYLMDYGIVS